MSKLSESIEFEYGHLTHEQVNGILNAMPYDVNFIDEQDLNVYYNHSDGQLFKRNPKGNG